MGHGFSELRQVQMYNEGRFSRVHNPRLSFYILYILSSFKVIVYHHRGLFQKLVQVSKYNFNRSLDGCSETFIAPRKKKVTYEHT